MDQFVRCKYLCATCTAVWVNQIYIYPPPLSHISNVCWESSAIMWCLYCITSLLFKASLCWANVFFWLCMSCWYLQFPGYIIKHCPTATLASLTASTLLSDCLHLRSPISLCSSHIHGACRQGNMSYSHAILLLGFQDKRTHFVLAHIIARVKIL